MYPAKRKVDDEVDGTEMEGVEHLGQYVYEMTQAKVKALGGQVMGKEEAPQDGYSEDVEELADELDEDPLHEDA